MLLLLVNIQLDRAAVVQRYTRTGAAQSHAKIMLTECDLGIVHLTNIRAVVTVN